MRRRKLVLYYELIDCGTYFNADTLMGFVVGWLLQMEIKDVQDAGISIELISIELHH